jgi:hypothetical protein
MVSAPSSAANTWSFQLRQTVEPRFLSLIRGLRSAPNEHQGNAAPDDDAVTARPSASVAPHRHPRLLLVRRREYDGFFGPSK